MKGVIYNIASGAIVKTISAPASMIEPNVQPGESFYYGEALEMDHWIDHATGTRQDRAELNVTQPEGDLLADGVDQIRVDAIPAGSRVYVKVNTTVLIDEITAVLDDLIFTTDETGSILIRVEHPRCKLIRIKKEAVEP
jgi:hypothetical protein